MLCYAIEHVIAAYDDNVHRQGITSYATCFGLLYGDHALIDSGSARMFRGYLRGSLISERGISVKQKRPECAMMSFG